MQSRVPLGPGKFHVVVPRAFVCSFIHPRFYPFSRTEEVERNSQLRTRAMREAEKRPSKTHRFTLLRVRFPDGIILQGTHGMFDLFHMVSLEY